MALDFDGTARLVFPDNPAIRIAATTPSTYMSWLNWSGIYELLAFPSATLMNKDAADGGGIPSMFWTINRFGGPPDRLAFWNGLAFIDSTTQVPINAWFHAATTWDQIAGTVTHYINGVATNQVLGVANGLVDNTDPLRVADRVDTPVLSYIGEMDDFRLYNRELSSEEILTIFSTRGNDGIVDGLVARYQMREKAVGMTATGVDTIVDTSPTQNNSSGIFGSPLYVDSELRFQRRRRML